MFVPKLVEQYRNDWSPIFHYMNEYFDVPLLNKDIKLFYHFLFSMSILAISLQYKAFQAVANESFTLTKTANINKALIWPLTF
jgi:hypothetical protein